VRIGDSQRGPVRERVRIEARDDRRVRPRDQQLAAVRNAFVVEICAHPDGITSRIRDLGSAVACRGAAELAGDLRAHEGLCSTTKAAVFFGLIAGDGTPTPGATNPPGTSSSGGSSSGSSGQAGDCP